MNDSFERLWVAFVDSTMWRRFVKRGIGAALYRNNLAHQVNMARRYITSSYQMRRQPTLFEEVKTFCLFIGHNKSGTSMIGTLLDAHPNVILADEADALQYIPAGFSRDQIYHILLKGSRREALKGRVTARRLTPYSFMVPGQWQGRYNRLHVIGDSTSGTSTRRFANDPALLTHLQRVMHGVDVKLIQVIRNPYDPISYMIIRGKRTFENAIAHYFASCEMLIEQRKRLDHTQLFAIRYEDFIHQPTSNLSAICQFLGIEAPADYLQACAQVLYQSPDQGRRLIAWDPHWIAVVKKKIEQVDFLHGYTFDE